MFQLWPDFLHIKFLKRKAVPKSNSQIFSWWDEGSKSMSTSVIPKQLKSYQTQSALSSATPYWPVKDRQVSWSAPQDWETPDNPGNRLAGEQENQNHSPRSQRGWSKVLPKCQTEKQENPPSNSILNVSLVMYRLKYLITQLGQPAFPETRLPTTSSNYRYVWN